MKSPFKFLDSYTKDDREIFFGRDREIEELYQKVFDSKLLLVYGVSGTGKSSLIHCGLANKFQDADWLPVVIRRSGNILDSFAAGIKAASVTPQKSKFITPADFRKGVRSLYLDYFKPVFFLFDQFEELFIFGSKEERKTFINIVKALNDSDIQCRMIFVMREEYMAWITEFERIIPSFFSNRVRIEKMSHINALEAIKGPCKAFNISLEEGFAEALLEKLSPGSEEVELTYLQVFLDKIFHSSVENYPPFRGDKGGPADPGGAGGSAPTGLDYASISFTLAILEKTGNVSDLLGSFLDEQISLMENPDEAMTVLKAFVSGKGTKRPADEQEAIDNIHSFGKEMPVGKIKEIIQSFVRLRVLRDKDDNGRYELRHDALAEKVFEKFSTAEKELLEVRQFIENAYQSYLKRKNLLSNDDLQYIAGRDSQLNLNSDLKGFMNESLKYQKASKRTFKWLISISAIAFVILLSTIVFPLIQKSNKSESVLLSKESVNQFSRPIDRLCLAEKAWEAYKTSEAEEALLKSFNEILKNPGNDTDFIDLRNKYNIEFEPVSSPLLSCGSSDDTKYIYSNTDDSIFIWNNNGKLVSRFGTGGSRLISEKMSKDGEYFGAVCVDSMLRVWRRTGELMFKQKSGFNEINPSQVLRFSTDNKIISISLERGANLIDTNGNTIQQFNYNGKVNAVDITDDGKFIAYAGMDSVILVWYYNVVSQKYELYNTLHLNADTVWSVDFSGNGKYILTSSSDGSSRIISINNKRIASISKTYLGDYRNQISVGYPIYAEFDKTCYAIIFRACNEIKDWENSYMRSIYVDERLYHLVQKGQVNKFDDLSFSPNKKYILISIGEEVSLLSNSTFFISKYSLVNNHELIRVPGKKPVFSDDSRYFYIIRGNRIESYFIDVDEISIVAREMEEKWIKYIY